MTKIFFFFSLSLLSAWFLFMNFSPRLIHAQENQAPTIASVTTAIENFGTDQPDINLLESPSLRTLYIHGTASDPNGCSDVNVVSQWSIKVYRSDHANGSSCSADKNDCYIADVALTGCEGGGDLDLAFQGVVSLHSFADPTDSGSPNAATNWTSAVRSQDAGTLSHSNSDTFEMNSLIALNVTASINYGALTLGSDSAQKIIVFTNTGNRAIDVDQSANGAMICDGAGSANIAVSSVHLSFVNGFTYGTNDQALALNPSHLDLSLGQRTNDDSPQIKNVYAVLRLPADGIGGACGNTLSFIAKSDQ